MKESNEEYSENDRKMKKLKEEKEKYEKKGADGHLENKNVKRRE
jgi:hypothetical protein